MFNSAHLSVEDHGGVDGPDHYTLTVSARTPGAQAWLVSIDGPGVAWPGRSVWSNRSEILRCELDAPPTLRQLCDLFEATRSDHDRIAALGTTPTGAELDGTGLTVTSTR